MRKRIFQEIFEKLNFESQIKFIQLNKNCNNLPKIKLKNLSKEIKEKLTDNIIKKYNYDGLKKENKILENSLLLVEKAKAGEFEVVKYLVKLGSDFHINDDEPLKWSARNGHFEILQYLISLGGNFNSCYDYAMRWSAYNGHMKIVKYLVSKKVNIHAQKDWALRWAAENGQLEMVKYLISLGADLHEYNNFALRYSAENGHLEIVKYLIECGADKQSCEYLKTNQNLKKEIIELL